MNLFYHPGACSLAAHIALIEAGVPYQLVSINMEKRTSDGPDFMNLNPKGFIPALEFDDGVVLAESVAVLLYVAHRSGNLLPKEDDPVRWQVIEALSFMTTEIHGNFKPFWKNSPQVEKDNAQLLLVRHFATIAQQLGDRPFLTGAQMTIADPYLYVMLRWASRHGIDVTQRFEGYSARMDAIPSVAKALVEEGLA